MSTKRESQVHIARVESLQQRMAQYHLLVQNVNLVNFDQAIEEKVTDNDVTTHVAWNKSLPHKIKSD